MKSLSGKQDEKKDEKKVKFTTPLNGHPVNKTNKLTLFKQQRKGIMEKVKMKVQKLPYWKKHQLAWTILPGQNILIYCAPVPKNMTPVAIPIMRND